MPTRTYQHTPDGADKPVWMTEVWNKGEPLVSTSRRATAEEIAAAEAGEPQPTFEGRGQRRKHGDAIRTYLHERRQHDGSPVTDADGKPLPPVWLTEVYVNETLTASRAATDDEVAAAKAATEPAPVAAPEPVQAVEAASADEADEAPAVF